MPALPLLPLLCWFQRLGLRHGPWLMGCALLPAFAIAIPPDVDLDDLHFENWGTGSGLPHNAVRCVLQGSDHSLWIATNGGLVRFDGAAMHDHTPTRPENHSSFYYRLLSETADGRIWVYSDIAGLWHINPESGKSTHLKLSGEEQNSILNAPFDLPDGRLLFANRTKLFFIDGDAIQERPIGETIDLLARDPGGRIVRSIAGRLSFLDGDRWVPLVDLAQGTDFRPRYITFVSASEGWAADINNGLAHWKDGVVTRFTEDNGLPDNRVRALFYDRDGSLWIGSYSGLTRWNNQHFEPVRGISLFSKDIVFSITQDISGSLWVGSNVGLFRIRQRPVRALSLADGLAGSDTRDLTFDPAGNLWAVSYGGGVTRIQPDGTIDRFGPDQGLSSRQLLSVGIDAAGGIFIGALDGLFKLQGARFQPVESGRNFNFTKVRRMRLLPDGTFAILTQAGIVRINDQQYDWLSFESIGLPKEPTDFLWDRFGRLWVGTEFHGIFVWDGAQLGQLFDNLKDGQIRALHQDNAGRIWIATSNGLGVFDDPDGTRPVTDFYAEDGYHYNPQMRMVEPDRRLRQFSVADGLPYSEFTTLLTTDDGFLWGATNFAVQRLHIPSLLGTHTQEPIPPVVYDHRDGLPNGRFTEISAGGIAADAQRIWIANQAGLLVVQGDFQAPEVPLPPVHLVSMRVNGEPVPFSENAVLPATTRNVAFAFSAANINPTRDLILQTRLLGLNAEWLPSTGTAFFSNLRGGDYTLQVRLACSRHTERSVQREFSFRIRPHFYQTAAFYLGLPSVLLTLGTLAFFNARHNVRRREAQLRQLVALRTEDYQQEAQRSAEANRAKSAFLANMSHEIRTPLNGVLGMAQVMRSTQLDPVQTDCLDTIERSGNYLLGILNDLLDLAKIEAGAIDLNPAPFILRDLLHGIERIMQPLAANKDLSLRVVVDEAVPNALCADSSRIQQILLNLLNNAVKFTAQGSVELQVRFQGLSPNNQVNLHFSVCDTGIGIAQDKRELVFQPFFQADDSISRRFGGTGLGLSICSLLCEKMHGRIWFEDNCPQGTCVHFTVRLPIENESGIARAQSVASKVPVQTVRGEPIRILVAEDNPVNQKVAHLLLQRLGLTADSATDGTQVLEALQSQSYHLILMDIQMPNMDGMETTRRICERFPADKRPVIVPMTAHVLQPELQAFAAAGMCGHIAKPIKIEALAAVLRSVADAEPAQS